MPANQFTRQVQEWVGEPDQSLQSAGENQRLVDNGESLKIEMFLEILTFPDALSPMTLVGPYQDLCYPNFAQQQQQQQWTTLVAEVACMKSIQRIPFHPIEWGSGSPPETPKCQIALLQFKPQVMKIIPYKDQFSLVDHPDSRSISSVSHSSRQQGGRQALPTRQAGHPKHQSVKWHCNEVLGCKAYLQVY